MQLDEESGYGRTVAAGKATVKPVRAFVKRPGEEMVECWEDVMRMVDVSRLQIIPGPHPWETCRDGGVNGNNVFPWIRKLASLSLPLYQEGP